MSAKPDTGLFDDAKAQGHPLWAKALYGFADSVPETEEYGISSFVCRARRPFRPEKFRDLHDPFPVWRRAEAA